ncbi:hypothetical protein ACHAQA_002942 [Verticillium albo-atrum]
MTDQTTPTTFPFMNLPPELRDDIWLHALPSQRVFHVANSTTNTSGSPGTHTLTFHNRPTPPTILQVCTQARDAARRAGFIQFPQPGPTPGVWFNTATDILYLDSDHRDVLLDVPSLVTPSCDYAKVPELRLVHHIGIQWCGALRGWQRPVECQTGERVKAFWATVMDALAEHMPLVTTLQYMAPMVHGGGQTGLKAFAISLRPMSQEARVLGFRLQSPPWEEVHAEFVKALRDLKESQALRTEIPTIVGWRLMRANPLRVCHGDIRAIQR